MSMLISAALLVVLMGFAIKRHVQVQNNKTVSNPWRHLRRR